MAPTLRGMNCRRLRKTASGGAWDPGISQPFLRLINIGYGSLSRRVQSVIRAAPSLSYINPGASDLHVVTRNLDSTFFTLFAQLLEIDLHARQMRIDLKRLLERRRRGTLALEPLVDHAEAG